MCHAGLYVWLLYLLGQMCRAGLRVCTPWGDSSLIIAFRERLSLGSCTFRHLGQTCHVRSCLCVWASQGDSGLEITLRSRLSLGSRTLRLCQMCYAGLC